MIQPVSIQDMLCEPDRVQNDQIQPSWSCSIYTLAHTRLRDHCNNIQNPITFTMSEKVKLKYCLKTSDYVNSYDIARLVSSRDAWNTTPHLLWWNLLRSILGIVAPLAHWQSNGTPASHKSMIIEYTTMLRNQSNHTINFQAYLRPNYCFHAHQQFWISTQNPRIKRETYMYTFMIARDSKCTRIQCLSFDNVQTCQNHVDLVSFCPLNAWFANTVYQFHWHFCEECSSYCLVIL